MSIRDFPSSVSSSSVEQVASFENGDVSKTLEIVVVPIAVCPLPLICELSSAAVVSTIISNVDDSVIEEIEEDKEEDIGGIFVNSVVEEEEAHETAENVADGSSYLIREDVRQDLITQGVITYFQSSEGKKKDFPWIKTWISRMSDLIVWTYHQIGLPVSLYPGAFAWLQEIFAQYLSYLPRFLQYLEVNKTRKSGTRYAHVIGWIAASNWMICKQPDAISISNMDIAHRYFRVCSKQLRASVVKENILSKRTSITHRIENNTMPSNGLQSVQEAVLKEHSWCLNIDKNTVLDKEIFNLFKGVLCTTMYAFAPQGRVGGIESLTWRDGIALVNNGVAMAEDFKTQITYLYQPVLASKESKPLLQLWLLLFLPWATKLQVPKDDDAPLFVTWEGLKDTNLSLAVRKFCKQKLNGINMGTTVIRAMVSTAAIEGETDGLLNRRGQLAVHSVNGHSEKTARQSYYMRDRTQEAQDAQHAFDIVCRRASHSSTSSSSPSLLSSQSPATTSSRVQALTSTTLSSISIPAPSTFNTSVYQQHSIPSITMPLNSNVTTTSILDSEWAILSNLPKQTMPDWGTQHPHIHFATNTRANWTVKEILTLGKMADNFLLQTNGGCQDKIMSTCLKHLRSKEGIEHRSTFHPRHITDTTRLKCGYQRYLDIQAGHASLPTWEDDLDQPRRSRKRQSITTSSSSSHDEMQQPRNKRTSAPTTFDNECNDNEDNSDDMIDLYVDNESDEDNEDL